MNREKATERRELIAEILAEYKLASADVSESKLRHHTGEALKYHLLSEKSEDESLGQVAKSHRLKLAQLCQLDPSWIDYVFSASTEELQIYVEKLQNEDSEDALSRLVATASNANTGWNMLPKEQQEILERIQ